ncbi:hypothetical protein QOT17_007249 [Balamuthia mandrillaris]
MLLVRTFFAQLLVVVCWGAVVFAASPQSLPPGVVGAVLTTLIPDVPHNDETIQVALSSASVVAEDIPKLLGSETSTKYYELSRLQPDRSYEVRISFPAIQPAIFEITFIGTEPLHSFGSTGRTLLNTEKLTFQTDGNSHIIEVPPSTYQHGKGPLLLVTATSEGVANPSLVQHPATTTIHYNIVLETLIWGVPKTVVVMGVVAAIAVIIIMTVLLPQLVPKLNVVVSSSKKSL